MKRMTIHRVVRATAAVACAESLLLTLTLGAGALSFTTGTSYSGMGTVTSSTTSTVATGLTYSKTTYTDANGNGQTMHAMEFNPATTGYMPITYQPKPSFGSTVENSIAAASAKGYDVLGGINGEFGSMNTENWGTLDGGLITNGRIVADSEYKNDVCLAFDNEGNFQLVKSEIAYHFYVEGKEILNAESGDAVIGSINKRYVGTNWWSPYCYFDYETGGATYTHSSVPGVEVVFNKTDGTELVVEGVLQGEVVAVNKNAYGTAMGKNQFVLYAQNGSSNYSSLAALKVGQKVQIYAEELNEDAKEIMKNAVSVTAATYPIVLEGKDNTANTPNAEDILDTPAQRTAIGAKADGTLVFVCTAGRGDSASNTTGITLKALANLMISLGCRYAVNLDGGGSTTMCVGGSTKITSGRAVSSSILICKRNEATTSPAERDALKTWIDNAKAASFSGEQKAIVDAAVAEATAVYNNTDAYIGSVTADFVRERMDIQTAMGVIKTFTPKTYISLDPADWSYDSSIMQGNSVGGALVFNNTNGYWPWASTRCDITLNDEYMLYFDITVASKANLQITVDGKDITMASLLAPDSCDSSGDILGYGKTFKGSIPVSALGKAGAKLTSMSICAVGTAGNGSKVTVRQFEFLSPYRDGDVNGNGSLDSTDARYILRYLCNDITFSAEQIAAADVDGDGKVMTSDALYILRKRVGLV